ncbi:hypothetical protein [Kitasatospora mediocidica]|uniref:hypothetical protein n=1 Tax=Kitasatospora mediocidica TaxID=58352 RepID=UPI00056229AD|nr:hypothetical protein [Kitasatospora mediocidica]
MTNRRMMTAAAVLAVLALPLSSGLAGAEAPSGQAGPSVLASPPDKAGDVLATGSITAVRPADGFAPQDTIVCTPQVQNPHNSSHVNGTVNVVVTLKCTKAVPDIAIRAALYRNNLLVKDSGQKNVANSSSAQNNAAVPCSNANYQGWMSYGVAFPPGYTPPTGSGSGFGNQVSITC